MYVSFVSTYLFLSQLGEETSSPRPTPKLPHRWPLNLDPHLIHSIPQVACVKSFALIQVDGWPLESSYITHAINDKFRGQGYNETMKSNVKTIRSKDMLTV